MFAIAGPAWVLALAFDSFAGARSGNGRRYVIRYQARQAVMVSSYKP